MKFPLKLGAIFALAGFLVMPSRAEEKEGMPDLAQQDQTCLPTSTANLLIWFGKHGYPNLISSGATPDEQNLHTVHRIIAATDAGYATGTEMKKVTTGIENYIHDAGYDCDVEFRGMEAKKAFSQDWLKENDDENKGFILLLGYCKYHPDSNSFSRAINAGHAVTLVNAEPNMLLIHDPAHYEDETGRKIVTPEVVPDGRWVERDHSSEVAGLLLLSGSLLGAPENSEVMLTGAVCITMHPIKGTGAPASPVPANPATPTVAGQADAPDHPNSSPTKEPTGASEAKSPSWWVWLFHLAFTK